MKLSVFQNHSTLKCTTIPKQPNNTVNCHMNLVCKIMIAICLQHYESYRNLEPTHVAIE